MLKRFVNILCLLTFFYLGKGQPVVCGTDSNYYSNTYNGFNNNHVTNAFISGANEIVAMSDYATYSSYISKFTAQGNVLWSYEYLPDYPQLTWNQYPWYSTTQMNGMMIAKDSSYYIFGQTMEHGLSINNVETPPTHLGGMIVNIDKFGNVISGKFLGNWYTSYTVNAMTQTDAGDLVIYLRSHIFPLQTKVFCVSTSGNIVWQTPIQVVDTCKEEENANPLIKQLKNGNILVVSPYRRDIDDTLFQPFLPPIIIPAPLHYINVMLLDGKTGKLLWNHSYQGPPLLNTNAPSDFIPDVKNITELPDGSIALAADMYIPVDNNIYWLHDKFSKRAVSILLSASGFMYDFVTYGPQNSSFVLQNAYNIGNNGSQLLLGQDSVNQNLVVYGLDAGGNVTYNKVYSNAVTSTASQSVFLPKQNDKSYYIFQGERNAIKFHLNITDASGNNYCNQLPPVNFQVQHIPWPWFVEKVHVYSEDYNPDFSYSPFKIARKNHPLAMNTDCEYKEACCKDIIDSAHIHNVSICSNETYTLPDKTVVKDSGMYYTRLFTTKGCDSIVFYKISVLKLPSELTVSPDTCLNTASTIQLRASPGYEIYSWNNVDVTSNVYTVSAPATYTVKVQNKCGEKTDSIHVYDFCNFPIYFPTAFTPNGDFLNDVLRVPPQNKNKLIRLRIYNRFGQLIFTTTDANFGWDGRYNGKPQPIGAYIYYLEMQGFTGEKFSKHGTVVLLR